MSWFIAAVTDRSSDTVHQDKRVAELEKQNADLSRKLRGKAFLTLTINFVLFLDQMHIT